MKIYMIAEDDGEYGYSLPVMFLSSYDEAEAIATPLGFSVEEYELDCGLELLKQGYKPYTVMRLSRGPFARVSFRYWPAVAKLKVFVQDDEIRDTADILAKSEEEAIKIWKSIFETPANSDVKG